MHFDIAPCSRFERLFEIHLLQQEVGSGCEFSESHSTPILHDAPHIKFMQLNW